MKPTVVLTGVISKGFDNEPAIRFREYEGNAFASFKVGVPVYKEKQNMWENYAIDVPPSLVNRIKQMKLDGGKAITVTGLLMIKEYTGDGGVKHTYPKVDMLFVDYASSGKKQTSSDDNGTSGQKRKLVENKASAKSSEKKSQQGSAEYLDDFADFEDVDLPF